MQKIFVSPSKLETFRKYFTNAYNGYITEEKVIEAVTGVRSWSPAMMRGTSWHRLIEEETEQFFNEKTGLYEVTVKEKISEDKTVVETFTFAKESVELVHDYKVKYDGFVSEIPHKWVFTWNGYEVTINMRIDSMFGYEVHDHKTSDKPPELKNHEDSHQWRIYLLATEAKLFQYNLFEFRDRVRTESTVELLQYVLFPYPGMKQDFLENLDLYVRFCKDRNLMEYVSKDRPR